MKDPRRRTFQGFPGLKKARMKQRPDNIYEVDPEHVSGRRDVRRC